MRKTIKVGITLLIVGVILLIIGIANNGFQSVYWQKGFHLVDQQEQTYHPKKITRITLNTANDIVIKRGDTATIHVAATKKLPTVTTKDGHVTITSKTSSSNISGFMFSDVDKLNTTTITIPKNTTLDWIKDGTQQTGDVRIQDLNVDRLELTADDNDVSLSNVTMTRTPQIVAESLSLTDVTAPSLNVTGDDVHINQGRFERGASKITSDDGDISIADSRFKTARVHAEEGDIRLSQNRVASLTASAETGDISLNQNHATNLTATTEEGDIHLSARKTVGIYAKTEEGDLNVFGHDSDDGGSYRYQRDAAQQYHLVADEGDITVTAAS